ncbi:MAG: peptide-methionine (S)-S-oxide reductase MsrA [Rhodobacteraceae bacterium]|nr:peptide-methionine (S)-S-oxide reductase MsrA [Paracoccaceae bacterium]MCY4195458.1 peptide-methionine (S)-S-oxide reductase MsrA [Paracoccaceae bacterium]MCY4327160.1 peptide-methionine (S)-S-oxide reductase MsrA [Paracoccaceae bacterium]
MMQRTNERKRNLREPHRILPLNAVWQKARLLVAAAGFALLGWTATAATDSVILAGGCFWCVESDFDSVTGVTATTSGYTGGTSSNPSYKSVSAGRGGHYEAVKVEFDPAQVSLRTLLDKFWRSIDVTDDGGQFCDRGHSYRTAVFVQDDQQRKQAAASKAAAETVLGVPFVTQILDASEFYPAEKRHQNYHLGTNRVVTRFGVIQQADAYKRYRKGCGRDRRVRELWGKEAAFAH